MFLNLCKLLFYNRKAIERTTNFFQVQLVIIHYIIFFNKSAKEKKQTPVEKLIQIYPELSIKLMEVFIRQKCKSAILIYH